MSKLILENKVLLSYLSWVTHLEDFHEFVRKYFIHCFISKGIDHSLVFPEEQIPVLCDLDADYNINPINSPVRLDRKDVQMNESCNKEENVNIQTADDDLVSVVTQSISEIDSDESKVEKRKEDGTIFEVGEIFDSYLYQKETIRTYENTNYVQIGIKDSFTLEAARKKAPKLVAKVNPILHYYSLVLACKFSGDKIESGILNRFVRDVLS